jgi:hypothetical protein
LERAEETLERVGRHRRRAGFGNRSSWFLRFSCLFVPTVHPRLHAIRELIRRRDRRNVGKSNETMCTVRDVQVAVVAYKFSGWAGLG